VRTDAKVKGAAKDAGALGLGGPLFFQGGFRSFSGHERNRLFMSLRGSEFVDVSTLSGLDSPADGRGFAVWDYDRDGRQDIALVNNNAPTLSLYRNRIGDIPGGLAAGRIIAVRFVGSNTTRSPAHGRSNRDGVGASVRLALGDFTLLREHRCGEGLAAQNSSTLILGIGQHEAAETLWVQWPSGRSHRLDGVAAGSLVTAWEDPTQSPNGKPFVVEAYRAAAVEARRARGTKSGEPLLSGVAPRGAPTPPLAVYTTMATWCAACKSELPEVARLRRTFGADQLALYGVPSDENDDPARLAAYIEQQRPDYVLLDKLPPRDVARVRKLVQDEFKMEVLPASIVTDAGGRVRMVTGGLPSVSDLRRLLAEAAPASALR
jgi:thiol-disulfide isomerase/thioredoxin